MRLQAGAAVGLQHSWGVLGNTSRGGSIPATPGGGKCSGLQVMGCWEPISSHGTWGPCSTRSLGGSYGMCGTRWHAFHAWSWAMFWSRQCPGAFCTCSAADPTSPRQMPFQNTDQDFGGLGTKLIAVNEEHL